MISAKEARELYNKFSTYNKSEDRLFLVINSLISRACSQEETYIEYTVERNIFPELEKKINKCGFVVIRGQEWNDQIDFVVSWDFNY